MGEEHEDSTCKKNRTTTNRVKEDGMKIKAHKSKVAPLVTGTICYLFMVIMLAHGCVQMVVAK